MVESIFIEHLLAVQLRRTPQSEDKVFLDAPEVIFRLSVCEAEHSARVSATKDMRNTIIVAINRDVAGEGIRLREENTLKCQEDTESDSESDHLGDIKPQRGRKSTKTFDEDEQVKVKWYALRKSNDSAV